MTRPAKFNVTDYVRFLAVALLLVEGGIHLQQVEGPLNAVPTINRLFVLNAIGAGAIALLIAGARQRVAVLGALGGLGLTIGALVSLAISRASTLFDYSEPTLRTAVGFAAGVELAVVLSLAAFVTLYLRDLRQAQPAALTSASDQCAMRTGVPSGNSFASLTIAWLVSRMQP